MRTWSWVFVFFFSASALATDLWEKIDNFVGYRPLCTAFGDGIHQFQRKTCSQFGCDEWNYEIRVRCSAEQATLTYWQGDQNFAQEQIDESSWRTLHGNLLRYKAQSAESFGLKFNVLTAEVTNNIMTVRYQILRGTQPMEEGEWQLISAPGIRQRVQSTEVVLFPIRESRQDKWISGK